LILPQCSIPEFFRAVKNIRDPGLHVITLFIVFDFGTVWAPDILTALKIPGWVLVL
jgi:hypothetical protein